LQTKTTEATQLNRKFISSPTLSLSPSLVSLLHHQTFSVM
jgi:hypothetical protein